MRQVEIGQQVIIVQSIRNNVYNEDKPMVGLVEVRDKDGVTLFFGYQTMKIGYNGNYTFGLSWTADPRQTISTGTYAVRTWAITCICETAEALSNVFESKISVV